MKAEAIASKPKDNSMKIEIAANGELCNIPNEEYKNPTTASVLETEDFCSFVIPKEKELRVKAGDGLLTPQPGKSKRLLETSCRTG